MPNSTIIEPFTAYAHGGVPLLKMTYHSKTVSVRWDAEAIALRGPCSCDTRYFDVFVRELDEAALEAEQIAIFERYRSQLWQNAKLWVSARYGSFHYAPIEAAQETFDTVRKYYMMALERMPASDEELFELHRAMWCPTVAAAV